MTDYNAYRSAAGISNKQFVDAVRAEFPKFSKIQASMCSNPAYGVCLLPEAEALLVEAFGNGPGLTATPAPAKKHTDIVRGDFHKKRNRLYVRLDDDLFRRVREHMAEKHFTHAQDFLEQLLVSALEEDNA